MRPYWKDAPKWAQWLAMDADGWWCWFAEEPDFDGEEWIPKGGEFLLAADSPDESGIDWDFAHSTLEIRPS